MRNNTKGRKTRYLEYECYEPMAIRVMAELDGLDRRDACHRPHRDDAPSGPYGNRRDQCGHGGDVPHRRPAFDVALEGINRLKRTVPIWKKEYFEDGEVWWRASGTNPCCDSRGRSAGGVRRGSGQADRFRSGCEPRAHAGHRTRTGRAPRHSICPSPISGFSITAWSSPLPCSSGTPSNPCRSRS